MCVLTAKQFSCMIVLRVISHQLAVIGEVCNNLLSYGCSVKFQIAEPFVVAQSTNNS